MTASTHQNVVHPPTTEEESLELAHHLDLNTVRPSHHAYVMTNSGRLKVKILYDNGATFSQSRNEIAESTT